MKILTGNEPILKSPTKEVDVNDIPNLVETIDRMHETMRSNNGVGLAAPQVGLDLNMFVMEWDGIRRTCINPIIVQASEDMTLGEEGCLSFPNLRLKIKRPSSITAAWYDEKGQPQGGTLEGLEARIFLHEWDHCQGICFTDRVGPVSLRLAKNKASKKTRRVK